MICNIAETVKPLLHHIKMRFFNVITILAISTFPSSITAGPAGYGVCQAGCSAVVMACYTAAGFTWGATLGATAPATIIGCNTAYGACQAACAAVLLAPVP